MGFQFHTGGEEPTSSLPIHDEPLGKESAVRRAIRRIVPTVLAATVFSTVALAATVPIGYISWDVNIPGTAGAFNISNQTGANASIFPDMTFPVVTPVTISPLTLTVDFTSGPPAVFGPAYFTARADGGYDGGTIPIGGANPLPTDATLTGTFSPLTLTLNDGSTVDIAPTFTASIPLDAAGLADGAFAIIEATIVPGGGGAVPEPATTAWVLMGAFLAGTLIVRRLPDRFKGIFVKSTGVLPVAVLVTCLMALPTASSAAVHLNATTSPGSGVAGVDFVNVTGSGYPTGHGTIPPASQTINFALSCGGAVVASTSPSTTTNILGSTWRSHVQLPGSLATGDYYLTLSGTTSDGTAYVSDGSCSLVHVTHTSSTLSGCAPASSLGIFSPPSGPAEVIAAAPNGCWICGGTGVKMVQLEPGGGPVKPVVPIPTGAVVNSCASNPATGESVCVGNDNSVYTIDSPTRTLTGAFASAADAFAGFSGGSCKNCGVAVDALNNHAVIAMGHTGGLSGTALQVFDLATNTFSPPTQLFDQVSEDIVINPLTSQILSANESNVFNILPYTPATGIPTGQFRHTFPSSSFGELDSTAVDCSTGIAGAPYEFSEEIVLTDTTQATFVPGAPGTWTAPSTNFTFPGTFLAAGASAMLIAPGSSHLGVVTGEFGGTGSFIVIQLPSVSGPGTGAPTVLDWAFVSCVSGLTSGFDPHTSSAYTSPNDGKAYGVFANGAPPSSIFRADLAGILARPRSAGTHTVIGDPGAGSCLVAGDGVIFSTGPI